jgi:hypothetical protein
MWVLKKNRYQLGVVCSKCSEVGYITHSPFRMDEPVSNEPSTAPIMYQMRVRGSVPTAEPPVKSEVVLSKTFRNTDRLG